jgi:glyoxylase-like metal-dependent hydrolase (beta-lactamase superfamily II)
LSTPTFPESVDDLPLVRSTTLGDFKIHVIEAGLQRLDGGAMFGVVAKPLWSQKIPADDRNRIPLGLRCVLVETADELVLIETGIGTKENEKFIYIYGVEADAPRGLPGADRLQAAIYHLGFHPTDIGVVVNTHLHFDHAGGNTWRAEGGEIIPSFPRARHFVQRGEWDWAHNVNERTHASYIKHNFDPVQSAGLMTLLDGPSDVVPGISVILTPGHTPYHQSVLVTSNGQTACYMADVAPTMSHLPLPWIMAYDVEPLLTLESKRELLRRASAEGWLLVSTHDPVTPCGRVFFDGATVEFQPELVGVG